MRKLGLTIFLAALAGAVGFAGGCDDESSSSSSSNGSSGTPALSYCMQGCTADADCCSAADPNCPGDYPSNPTCTADGWCMFPQCSTNDDCTMGGVLTGWECFEVNIDLLGSVHMCGQACADDTECTAPSTCSGDAVSGDDVFCATESTGGGCDSDSDCTGLGTCDTASGACVCNADADCTATGVDACIAL